MHLSDGVELRAGTRSSALEVAPPSLLSLYAEVLSAPQLRWLRSAAQSSRAEHEQLETPLRQGGVDLYLHTVPEGDRAW